LENDMNTKLALMLSLALSAGAFSAHAAEGGATKEEAVAMVKKGVAHVKSAGKDKAYADISDKANTEFHHQDLYLTVYQLDGTVKAHGANAKMIGKNLMEIKDVDGKYFVKERVELAKKNKPFWQEYKFTNPVSGKIEPKAMYCVPEDDMVVCGGVYLK
jgi:signal transduction histidine kinase